MQPAGAGAEREVYPLPIVGQRLSTAPKAGPAVNAFLALKKWYTLRPRSYGLAAAQLDTDLSAAFLAQLRIEKHHMISIPGSHL